MNLSDKPLAEGRTAEIYAWEDGRVIKLLRPGFPASLIQQEEVITSAISQAGLPAPKVYGLAEVGGRTGVIYERIDGPTLTRLIEINLFQMEKYAEILARLHAALHVHSGGQLPRQKEILAAQINEAQILPAQTRDAVLSLLERLPEGDRLCHNDMHPLNVMIGPLGPLIIDWESASRGSPCADVARTTLTVALSRLPEGAPHYKILNWIASLYMPAFAAAYLKSYRSSSPADLHDLRAWQTVQAAAKIQYEPSMHQHLWLNVIRTGLTAEA